MVATLNSDCTNLTLTSEFLTPVAGKTYVSLVLKSRLNCSLTETSVTVSSLIGSISNKQIVIPATTYYTDFTKPKYCDGIYYFELQITYDLTVNGVTTRYLIKDGACKLVDCDLKCKVNEYYTKCKDRTAYYQYYALLQGNDCDSCYCTEMCSLYSELKTLLNDNNISTTSSGCGCT